MALPKKHKELREINKMETPPSLLGFVSLKDPLASIKTLWMGRLVMFGVRVLVSKILSSSLAGDVNEL